jgi:hypothetical protein
LNVPLSMDPVIYSDKVLDIALNVAQILKMTSPLSRGHVFNTSLFYGDNVQEILLANIDPYDKQDLLVNWRDAAPIRILRHPKTDLNLYLLNRSVQTSEGGLSVISINIPMLATQYRLWCQYEGQDNGDSPESIATFLTRYPINNMLYSHFDLALFNRLFAMFKGLALSNGANHSPFWQLDLTHRVDAVLVKQLIVYRDREADFDNFLRETPSVTADNLKELFRLPPTLINRQNTWALTLTRIPLIMFLVQTNAEFEYQRNGQYLKDIRRFFIRAKYDRSVVEFLPLPLQLSVTVDIDNGILPYVPPI